MKFIGNSKGHVLVYSLFLIALIGTLITAWLTITSTQTTTDIKRLNSQAANSIAKSGLESFITYLYKYSGGSKVDYLKLYLGWGPYEFANGFKFKLILKNSNGDIIAPNEIQAGTPANGLRYFVIPEVTLNNFVLNDYISYKFTVDTNTGVINNGPNDPSTQPVITSNPIVYPVDNYSATGFDTGEKNVLAASEIQLNPIRDAYFDSDHNGSFSLEEQKSYFKYQFTNNLVPTQFDYGSDGSITNLDKLRVEMEKALLDTTNSTGQYIFKCDCAGSYPTANINFPPSIMGNKKFIVYIPGNLTLGDNQENQTVNWIMQGMLLIDGDFSSEQQSNVVSINNIIVNGTLTLKGGNNENQSNYSTFLSVLSDTTNNNYYVQNTTSITYSPYTTVNTSNTGFDPTRSP